MVDRFRIAIVDVYPLFREGVVHVIRRDKNLIVVGEGTTVEDAEQLVREKKPDVLLLEVAVPGSLKAAQAILRAHQNVKVVFLASAEDQEHATQALYAGAQGYIMKGITGEELVKAIKAVHGGERYVTPDLAWRLITKSASPQAQCIIAGRPHLSIREQQVLDYTSRGLTSQEIARMMGLGLSTIKHYKTLAFRKIGVRNRLEAIVAVSTMVKQNWPDVGFPETGSTDAFNNIARNARLSPCR